MKSLGSHIKEFGIYLEGIMSHLTVLGSEEKEVVGIGEGIQIRKKSVIFCAGGNGGLIQGSCRGVGMSRS